MGFPEVSAGRTVAQERNSRIIWLFGYKWPRWSEFFHPRVRAFDEVDEVKEVRRAKLANIMDELRKSNDSQVGRWVCCRRRHRRRPKTGGRRRRSSWRPVSGVTTPKPRPSKTSIRLPPAPPACPRRSAPIAVSTSPRASPLVGVGVAVPQPRAGPRR